MIEISSATAFCGRVDLLSDDRSETVDIDLTVDQVADRVAQAYDSISKEDFLNQAKASNYVNDYA